VVLCLRSKHFLTHLCAIADLSFDLGYWMHGDCRFISYTSSKFLEEALSWLIWEQLNQMLEQKQASSAFYT